MDGVLYLVQIGKQNDEAGTFIKRVYILSGT